MSGTMQMWTELQLAVPGYVGHQARAALARRSDEAGGGLPAAFFHYTETTAQAVPDRRPPVRILGDGHKIRVVGIGDEGADLVLDHARTVAELLARPGESPRWRLTSGTFRLSWERYPLRQILRSFAMSLKDETLAAAREGRYDDPALVVEVEAALTSAIAAQTQWLTGVALRSIRDVSIRRSVGVHVHGSRYISVLDIDFRAPVRFIGPWQVGKLQARGYGRLTTSWDSMRGGRA